MNRRALGVAVGIVLALTSSIGVAVGWSSHPVGGASHPQPVRGTPLGRLPGVLEGLLPFRDPPGTTHRCGGKTSHWYRINVRRHHQLVITRLPGSDPVRVALYEHPEARSYHLVGCGFPNQQVFLPVSPSTDPSPLTRPEGPFTATLSPYRTYLLQVAGSPRTQYRLATS